MKKKIVIVFFSILFIMACGNERKADPLNQKVKVHVKTEPVKRADMADTIKFYGEVAFRDEIFLASQFDGRLSDFHLYLGDVVKQGQQIGQIIPAQREALLQVLPHINNDLRPVLEKQIRAIPLASPLNGTILKVFLHNGDVLQKGQPIVHIGNLDVLDVIGELPVSALPLARKQSTIGLKFIDFKHPALNLPVAAIGGKVDAQKQTVPIRLTLNNPDHQFRPGMRALLFFEGRTYSNTLVIPRSALLEKEGVYSAFVIKKGIARERLLKIGLKQADKIEVLAGLKEGDQVVTEKAYSLVDGMEVVVE